MITTREEDMSRGFFGGGGSGTRKGSTSKNKGMMGKLTSFKRKRSMEDLIEEKTSSRVKSQKEILEDLLEEKMYSPRKKYGFSLPGTVPHEEREVSRNQEKAIEIIRNKKLKKKIKVRDKKVRIIPKPYGDGRLDASGKIFDKSGNVILTINSETGVITNKLGLKVGKYDPHSLSNEFKIERLIHKYSSHNIKFNPFVLNEPK